MEKLERSQKEHFSFVPNLITGKNHEGNAHRRTKSNDFFMNRVPALINRERLRIQILEEMKKENEEIVSG